MRGAGLGYALAHESGDFIGLEGSADGKALHGITAELRQSGHQFLVLDALHGHVQAQCMGKLDDGIQQDLAFRAVLYVGDKHPIDLDARHG